MKVNASTRKLTNYSIVILISLAMNVLAIKCSDDAYEKRQRMILEAIPRINSYTEQSSLPIDTRLERMKRQQEEFICKIESVLELEFSKLQNEYESIEIWTGILTIAFLTFSFFSIFKTEQLENQSKDVLRNIHRLVREGEREINKFETKSKKRLDNYNSDIQSVKECIVKKANNILRKDKENALAAFEKNVENTKNELEEILNNQIAVLRNDYIRYEKELRNIAKTHLEILEDSPDNPSVPDRIEEELDKELEEREMNQND